VRVADVIRLRIRQQMDNDPSWPTNPLLPSADGPNLPSSADRPRRWSYRSLYVPEVTLRLRMGFHRETSTFIVTG